MESSSTITTQQDNEGVSLFVLGATDTAYLTLYAVGQVIHAPPACTRTSTCTRHANVTHTHTQLHACTPHAHMIGTHPHAHQHVYQHNTLCPLQFALGRLGDNWGARKLLTVGMCASKTHK